MSYVTPMAFDRRAGRIVVLAAADAAERPETWTFDVCTNTWTRMHPNREPDESRSQLVYDVDSDLTITFHPPSRRVWAYDLDANTWTAQGAAPIVSRGRLIYDPVSGLIVVEVQASLVETDPPELWAYDIDTDIWTPIREAGTPAGGPSPGYGLLAYDPSVDRLIAYTRSSLGTWLFDLRTRTGSRSGAVTPVLRFGWWPSGGEIAYEEATQRTVVFSDGLVVAYDAAADRWEILAGQQTFESLPTGPTARMHHSMIYDPINERLVVYGGTYRTSNPDPDKMWVQANDVLAFDPATGTWTTLLKASRVQALPS